MASKELDATREKYLKKFNTVYQVNNYTLIGKLMELTNEYDEMMSFHVSSTELYKFKLEFDKERKIIEKQREELNRKYKKAISIINNSKKLNTEVLDKLLEEITIKDHAKYSNGSYIIESLIWHTDKRDKVFSEYNDKCSKINNVMSIVAKRLTEASKIYERMQTMKKLELLRDINDSFVSLKTKEEQIKIVSKYEKYCKEVAKQLSNNKRTMDICNNIVKNINKDEINLETFKFIEKHIEKIVSKELLPYLNDPDKYETFMQEYKESMPEFYSEEKKYHKRLEKYRESLFGYIRQNREELMVIDAFNKKTDRKIRDINVNTSLDVLNDVNEELVKEIKKSKIKAIDFCYEYIIYFYAGNDILDKMPRDLYTLYETYRDKIDSEIILNKCYREFVKLYFSCLYNANYDLETTVSGNYKETSREVLISNIEKMKRKYIKLDIPIPPELLDLDSDKEELDIASLYELYVKFDKIGFKLFNYEEITFGR